MRSYGKNMEGVRGLSGIWCIFACEGMTMKPWI